MRSLSSVILTILFVCIVIIIGSASAGYVTVKQMVSDSPIELPALPQFGNTAGQAKSGLFDALKTPTLIVPATLSTSAQSSTPSSATNSGARATPEPAIASWADPRRITVLLLGADARPTQTLEQARTDSMMIVSVDPVRKTAVLLSVPRDIWLDIPGYGQSGRIDYANEIGELIKYPGGGPALSVKTVESVVGIPIQRYIFVHMQLFRAVVDVIGPIQVCPQMPIHDPNYPAYDSPAFITVDFQAGCQDLDSVRLLEYSRVRHNSGDDYGRAARQQEVVKAVRDKVLSMGGVAALVGQATTLWASMKTYIHTDMTFDEMVELAQLGQTIPKQNITSVVITPQGGAVIPENLATGEQVLSPVYEKIHELVETAFDAPPGSAQDNSGASSSPLKTTKIAVLNGSGLAGIAKTTADKLKASGFNVVTVGNADQPSSYDHSFIRVYNNDSQTAKALAQSLGLASSTISEMPVGQNSADIELIIGKDLLSQP